MSMKQSGNLLTRREAIKSAAAACAGALVAPMFNRGRYRLFAR